VTLSDGRVPTSSLSDLDAGGTLLPRGDVSSLLAIRKGNDRASRVFFASPIIGPEGAVLGGLPLGGTGGTNELRVVGLIVMFHLTRQSWMGITAALSLTSES
jgi:hypothetical protein